MRGREPTRSREEGGERGEEGRKRDKTEKINAQTRGVGCKHSPTSKH